jgi:hypothetical protein
MSPFALSPFALFALTRRDSAATTWRLRVQRVVSPSYPNHAPHLRLHYCHPATIIIMIAIKIKKQIHQLPMQNN